MKEFETLPIVNESEALPARCTLHKVDGQEQGKRKVVQFRAAPAVAMTSATAAVGCGVCCVLPFALPAVAVASTGSIFLWFAGAQLPLTVLAIVGVVGSWGWVWLQTRRSRAQAASSTLYWLGGATAMSALAIGWRWIEPYLVSALQGVS